MAEYSKHDFEGDTMDQHAWIIYTTEWLKQVRRVVKLSGVFAIFVDWRQLAALTDAVQMSGWIYRGIAVWSKLNPRPQKGRFAAGAEYIVWGSNGPLPPVRNAPILPGVFNYATVNSTKRIHQTEKPLLLMQDIVQICERGGKILDPFCGSGSTLEAAELKGFDSYGIEITDYYAKKSAERLSNIKIQTSLNIKNSEMLEGCTE